MPDLDIVERRIPCHWRSPYRLIKGDLPIEDVVEGVIKAIAAQIRADHWAPPFEERLSRLQDRSMRQARPKLTIAGVSERIESRFSRRTPTHEFEKASRRLATLASASRTDFTATNLAREYCWELARHHLFGRLEPTLVGSSRRFRSIDELLRFEQKVRESADPSLEQLGRKLALSPASTKVRAPRRQRPRRSTAELLQEPISGSR
jgi:hypothetical protein